MPTTTTTPFLSQAGASATPIAPTHAVLSPENIDDLQLLGTIELPPTGYLSVSPDWRFIGLIQYVQTEDFNQTLTVWDSGGLLAGEAEWTPLVSDMPIGRKQSINTTILFLPGLGLAAFTYCPSCDETMKTDIWAIDPSSDPPVHPLDVGGKPVSFVTPGGEFKDVAALPDGVAAVDWEGIKLLRLRTPEASAIEAAGYTGLELSPGGQLAALFNQDGITVLDLDSWEVLQQIPANGDRIWAVALSPDGRFLASAGDRPVEGNEDLLVGNILVRDTSEYQVHLTIPYSTGTSPVLGFSPNGSILAARVEASEITLWATETGRRLLRLKGANNLSFSPAGDLLLVQRDEQLTLWGVP